MAKKGIGKKIGYVLVVGIILYILYMVYKKVRYGKCLPFEELHEHDANSTWMSVIKYDENGLQLRPEAAAAKIGDSIVIKNTEGSLNGTYQILAMWYDNEGRIGSFRVPTPSSYVFKYDSQQGNTPIDATYFGVGEICIEKV